MTSISEHFANIGDYFAADTETALAPECFKGRDHVRLFQAYNPDYSFYIDLAQLDNDDWSELKVNLENPAFTPFGTTPILTFAFCSLAESMLVVRLMTPC